MCANRLSTIRGTVSDSSGAVVAGAGVEIVDVLTNVRRETVSNEAGNFELPELKPATYRLRAQMAGFKTHVAEGILLESNFIRRIDVALEIGDAATTVNVNAAPGVIDMEEAKVASAVSNQTYEQSPLGARNRFNPNMMLVVLPQVQPSESGNGFAVAGATGNQIEEGMDGSATQGTVNQIHNMEDVSEVKIVTNNNSAEYPRAGYFNLVGKRGYNEFHGNSVYYFQNSALNAREAFDARKTPLIYHIFGASAGGRIVRDRTFFYASYNGMRDNSQNQLLLTTPTTAMRGGDFSQLAPTVIRDPLNGQPFAGNLIPTSRISGVSQRVQNGYITEPNRGAPGQLNQNLTVIHPYPVDLFKVDYATIRIDHEVSSKNHFFGRMNNRWTPYVLITNWPKLAWTRQRYAWHQVYGDTHIFSPSLVHTMQFGWYLNRVDDGKEVDGYKPVHGDQIVSELGIQGVNPQGLSAMGFPTMNITGYPTLSVNPGGLAQKDHDRTFSSSWTWSRGQHTMKFGGELRNYIAFNGTVPAGTYGAFTFNGTYTGTPYADFLLGIPFSSQRLDPITDRFQRSNELGIYFDDTWKFSQRLTLNLGLRWDRYGATEFDDGLMFNWDSQTGDVVVPRDAMSRISPLYPVSQIRIREGEVVPSPDNRNLAPRLGAAYRLSDKTVLRGGYGIYNEFLGQFRFNNTGGPFQLTETFNNVITNGVPLLQFPRAFPATGAGIVASQSVAGYPLDVRNGYLQQFSFTIERQVGDTGLRATYVGTRGIGLNYSLNRNKPQPSDVAFTAARRPFPQFISANTSERDGRLKYDGLTLRAHRVTGAFTFDVHWTWAQSLSNYLNLENPYKHDFWNRTGDVPTHRVVASAFWNLPVGPGKSVGASLPRAVNAVVGGWQLGYVGIFANGLWFSPSFSGSDPSGTNTSGGIPDRIRDGNLPAGDRTTSRWFDTAAFVTPPRGRFGNSGLNILQGPGRHVHNLSLEKEMRITERIRFQLMAAGTNIFNRAHFTFPASNISVPSGGVISASYNINGLDRASARRIELRGRIKW